MRNRFYDTSIVLISLSLVWTASVYGQSYSHARSLGMAKAYTSVARGVAAAVWNPANLALPDRPSFDLNLVGVGAKVGNSSFSKRYYDAFVGEYISSSDIQDILSSIPEDGLKLYVDSDIQAIGFAIGPFALTTSGKAASNLHISRDYMRLFLEGLQWDENYDVGNNWGEAFGYTNVSASFAFPIRNFFFEKLYFGTNVNYLIGLGYANVVESSGQFYNGFESQGEGSVKVRYAERGSGFGLDFGLAAINRGWTLGLSLKNVMSRINWNTGTEQFEGSFHTDGPINVENSAEEDSVLKHNDETVAIGGFSSSLPTELRIGLSRQSRAFLFSLDFHQGFSKRPGLSSRPYLGFGMEWRGLGILPLRSGIGLGGDNGLLAAAGFGLKLGPLRLDLGMSMGGALTPGRAKSMGIAASTALIF